MKSKTILFLFFQILIVSSCGQASNKEEAEKYYGSYVEAIRPFKIGVETMLKDSKELLEQSFKATGDIKLSTQDSLKLTTMFADFERLTEDTKIRLKDLRTFKAFDLKDEGLKFVDKFSKTISGSYKGIVFPLQDRSVQMDQEKLGPLIDNYKKQLVDANQEFVTAQNEFLDKFGITVKN